MVKIDCEWSQDEYDDFESGAWNAASRLRPVWECQLEFIFNGL